MWVHATLADTALRCYEELVGPLSPADEATYYEEMTRVAEVFGVPRDQQPATIADFRAYVDDTVAAMDVTPIGKDLATFILDPTLPLGLHVPLKPLLAAQRLFTLGSLPAPIRSQLGVAWTPRSQDRYDRAQRAVRRVFKITPRPLRVAGPQLNGVFLLWLAGRHVRQFEERQKTISARAAA